MEVEIFLYGLSKSVCIDSNRTLHSYIDHHISKRLVIALPSSKTFLIFCLRIPLFESTQKREKFPTEKHLVAILVYLGGSSCMWALWVGRGGGVGTLCRGVVFSCMWSLSERTSYILALPGGGGGVQIAHLVEL